VVVEQLMALVPAAQVSSGSTTSYKNYYFNSVYNTGTNATNSSAFYLNGSQNINVTNNNLFGTVGNAIEILASTNFNSNYNNLYSTGSYVGNWSGNQTTLADWQTASSQDANSLSVDPLFISGTDLHLQEINPLSGHGITIAGITADIDNDLRDAFTPTIGCIHSNNWCR